jgi:hypothetical protein
MSTPPVNGQPTVESNCPNCGASLLWRGEVVVAQSSTAEWALTDYSFVVECIAKECECAIDEAEWSELSDKAAQRLRPLLRFGFEREP